VNNIHIKFIPGAEQRYSTSGDWYYDEHNDLVIAVTNDAEPNPTEETQLLVAVHELVEALLCRRRRIPQKMVDDFDLNFKGQEDCLACGDWAEPGDDPAAPYCQEHRFAMIVEHMLAHEMGVHRYGVIK
jgi:hypothetical protein